MADQLISTADHDTLPGNYVRPEAQRPRLADVLSDASIPVVDLANPDRAKLVSQVGAACRSHGFFQVLNHGVPVELTLSVLAVAHDFFRLPAEEKAKLYSDDPAKKIRLSTSFNVRKETVHNWRDYLRLHCYPLHRYLPDWPSNPTSFRLLHFSCLLYYSYSKYSKDHFLLISKDSASQSSLLHLRFRIERNNRTDE